MPGRPLRKVIKPAPEVGYRDENGRFVPGNPGGSGNPNAASVKRLRTAAIEATDPEDMVAIMRKMITMAKHGHVKAAQFVFDRVLGKADQKIKVENEAAERIRERLLEWLTPSS